MKYEPIYQEKIDSGKAFGTLGQDNNADLNPCNVSHRVLKIIEHPDGFAIISKILDTPKGKKLRDILDQCQYAMRGTGVLNGNEVGDFKILSVDMIPREQNDVKEMWLDKKPIYPTPIYKPLVDRHNLVEIAKFIQRCIIFYQMSNPEDFDQLHAVDYAFKETLKAGKGIFNPETIKCMVLMEKSCYRYGTMLQC